MLTSRVNSLQTKSSRLQTHDRQNKKCLKNQFWMNFYFHVFEGKEIIKRNFGSSNIFGNFWNSKITISFKKLSHQNFSTSLKIKIFEWGNFVFFSRWGKFFLGPDGTCERQLDVCWQFAIWGKQLTSGYCLSLATSFTGWYLLQLAATSYYK